MKKYKSTDVPDGEKKRICDMSTTEYLSWRGRCGGRSRSQKKLRAQRKNVRRKKPGLSRYHATVKLIAQDGYETVAEVMALGDDAYPIDETKAQKLLAAGREYRERNP